MHLVKYINHFTNERVSNEQEAESLWNCMVYKDDPERTLKVFEALENKVKNEMAIYQKKSASICMAINTKYKPEPVKAKVYDLNFDKPLSEINVDFTEVKAS